MNKKIWTVVIVLAVVVLAGGTLIYGLFGTTVRGKVVEKWSNKPISNAKVEMDNEVTTTDERGRFWLKAKGGEQDILISAKGYEKYKALVDVFFLLGKNLGDVVLRAEPAQDSAEIFIKRYWKLMDDGKYTEAYDLLCPGDKKWISKKIFIEKNQANAQPEQEKVISSIGLEDERAEITASVNTSSGKITEVDKIVFIDGRWREQLEVDELVLYGVSQTIAAIVNGEVIRVEELDAEFDRVKDLYTPPLQSLSKPKQEEMKEKLLLTLIDEMLIEQEAKKHGISVRGEEVDDQYEQYQAGRSSEEFKAELEKAGMVEEDLKEEIRFQLLRKKLYGKVLGQDKNSEEAQKAWLEEVKKKADVRIVFGKQETSNHLS